MNNNGEGNVIGSIAACGAVRSGSKPGHLPVYFIDQGETLDEPLQKQIKGLLDLGWETLVFQPDLHLGYGVPIGTLMTHKTRIFPEAIGKDIGCGILAITLKGLTEEDFKFVDPITLFKEFQNVEYRGLTSEASIPEVINHTLSEELKTYINFDENEVSQDPLTRYHSSDLFQLGTLGGGNHFLEILKVTKSNCKDLEEGEIVLIVHSGSRGYGSRIAQEFMHHKKGLERELKDRYWGCYKKAHFYAIINRFLICNKMEKLLKQRNFKFSIKFLSNHSHNCLTKEEDLWIHQKGVNYTQRRYNDLFFIPGDMKNGAYGVYGCDSKRSYWSLPHGAGRVLSRRAARERGQSIEERHIKTNLDKASKSFREEAPQAYKNLERIIGVVTSRGLGTVACRLKPLITLKE